MNNSINKELMTVVFGFLFIGSAAAILGMYRVANHTERTPGCVIQEPDGGTFVYGAHA
ncbi:MAG: hypothetical protein WEB37_10355 [Bacteroidota bacterium]